MSPRPKKRKTAPTPVELPVIEKGVALPSKRYRFPYGGWTKMAKKMEDGDSVILQTMSEVSSLRSALHRIGASSQSRVDGNFIRVWKEEKS